VTDALIMGGIAKGNDPAEICVQAVEAGADVLLMPPDAEQAINAIYQAVEQGRIRRDRILASLQRIQQAKQKLQFPTPSDPESLLGQIATPTATATARQIVEASLQTGGDLPISGAGDRELINLIVVDNLLGCDFLSHSAPTVTIPGQFGYKSQLIEQRSLTGLNPSEIGLLQVFSRGNPFRGNARLSQDAQNWFKNLLRLATLGGLAIYGSPYILQWFYPHLPPNLPWAFSYGQMPLAQTLVHQALFPQVGHQQQQNEAFT